MRTAALLLVAAMAGCAAPQPVQSELGPFPADHLALLNAHLAATLKDPYSAVVRHIAGPAPYAVQRGLIHGGGYASVWAACYAVNAKNSYGGYTGPKLHVATFRDGRLVGSLVEDSGLFEPGARERDFCRAAGR
jgi:hypothetical protein